MVRTKRRQSKQTQRVEELLDELEIFVERGVLTKKEYTAFCIQVEKSIADGEATPLEAQAQVLDFVEALESIDAEFNDSEYESEDDRSRRRRRHQRRSSEPTLHSESFNDTRRALGRSHSVQDPHGGLVPQSIPPMPVALPSQFQNRQLYGYGRPVSNALNSLDIWLTTDSHSILRLLLHLLHRFTKTRALECPQPASQCPGTGPQPALSRQTRVTPHLQRILPATAARRRTSTTGVRVPSRTAAPCRAPTRPKLRRVFRLARRTPVPATTPVDTMPPLLLLPGPSAPIALELTPIRLLFLRARRLRPRQSAAAVAGAAATRATIGSSRVAKRRRTSLIAPNLCIPSLYLKQTILASFTCPLPPTLPQ